MNPFLWLITTLISLYIWILIAAAVLSWLVAFNVVNPHNQVVRAIGNGLFAITEPGAADRSAACCRTWAGSTFRR